MDIIEKFLEILKKDYKKVFHILQEKGYHIIPNHFYSPVPDTRFIKNEQKIYKEEIFNFNKQTQLNFFNYLSNKYFKEWKWLIQESGFNINNGTFEGMDALICYAIIKEFLPEKIVEIGSGNSTKLFSIAGIDDVTCIDPYYDGNFKFCKIIKEKVENVDFEVFGKLRENDILFIDSSHTVKSQNDVVYLIFEVLPFLKKGVIIHFHDIFLPLDYPVSWIKDELRFWNEQFIVGAFLIENKNYNLIISNSFLGFYFPEIIKKSLPIPEDLKNKYEKIYLKLFNGIKWFGGGSLWLKKL